MTETYDCAGAMHILLRGPWSSCRRNPTLVREDFMSIRPDALVTAPMSDADCAIWQQFTSRWPTWAAVKKTELDTERLLDDVHPDFLDSLLPFAGHPAYLRAAPELKARVLSCGWIAYNEKVVQVETAVISPACDDVIRGAVPALARPHIRQTLAQTLVDEAYHVLIVLRASDAARARRGLQALDCGPCSLVVEMRQARDRSAVPWQRILIQLLCAAAIETSISDYLGGLSTASGIQPLNRITTELHRRDEAVHAGIFRELGRALYGALNTASQREFFQRFLPAPWIWFSRRELEVWRRILRQLSFPGADDVVQDCTPRTGAVSNATIAAVEDFANAVDIRDPLWGGDLAGWIRDSAERLEKSSGGP
jgi:hypothetical protein